MQFTGKIKGILPQVTGTSSKGDWIKQPFVIGVQNGNYEDMVAMEAWGDQVSTIESIDLGAEVTVDVNIKSREYGGKWYTNIQAWKIEVKGGIKAPQGYAAPTQYATGVPPTGVHQQPTAQSQLTDNQNDGLPF